MFFCIFIFFFFSSRRRHTRSKRDWSSDVCSSDLEAEWREIELAGHCVVAITTTQAHPRAQGESLDDLDGNPHQSGDETEAEGCVGLPLRGALPWSLEWEVVRRERARRLGHGTQALRAPDPAIVALVEQPRQHPAGAGDLAHETESRQQLDPIERERDVGDVALGVGAHGIAEDLEDRLEELLTREDEERASRCGR